MLTLVGMGLNDENDLTLRGIEAAKRADKLFLELYTSFWNGKKENLEKIVGKKIVELQRKDLEDNSKKFLQQAKNSDTVIFIQGDPLVATAHEALITEAKKAGITTRIVHNASIFSAITETGLHIYRFGPTVTIPFAEKTGNKLPKSIYDTISENKKRNLHTLCLLDVIAESKKYMNAHEAVEILLKMEKEFKGKAIHKNSEAVVFESAGSEKNKITSGKLSELIGKEFENYPQVMILTGSLHFTEKEYLRSFLPSSL
jgi:diphthine synthase